MLASDDEELIEYARFLSQQARDPFPHYEHSRIGYNYRMSNVLAAIGRGQLKVLDERVKRKREIFQYYNDALGEIPGIEFMPEPEWSRSNRWLTVVLITPEEFGVDREQVRLALGDEDIEARPVWKPMHMQPVFNPQITQISRINSIQNSKIKNKNYPSRVVEGEVKQERDGWMNGCLDGKGQVSRKGAKAQRELEKKRYSCRIVGGEVAEELFERGLCLPSGTAMTKEDLDRVIDTVFKCRSRAKAQRRKEGS